MPQRVEAVATQGVTRVEGVDADADAGKAVDVDVDGVAAASTLQRHIGWFDTHSADEKRSKQLELVIGTSSTCAQKTPDCMIETGIHNEHRQQQPCPCTIAQHPVNFRRRLHRYRPIEKPLRCFGFPQPQRRQAGHLGQDSDPAAFAPAC